jgi:hypothetical protein
MNRVIKNYQKSNSVLVLPKVNKPSKYKNKKVEICGIKFDSIKESNHYKRLVGLALMQGFTFEVHKRFPIVINGVKLCTYVSDFVLTYPNGAVIVQDVKGVETPVFKLKKKLMKIVNGIDIEVLK